MSSWRLVGWLAICLLVSCRNNSPIEQPSRRTVRLMTAPEGTGFFALGEALARDLTRLVPRLDVVMVPSTGAVANVRALDGGRADLALTFADVAYLGSSGRLDSTVPPLKRLRGVAVLQVTRITLVARRGASIRSPRDLRGRRVGVGPSGSGTAVGARMILEAFGLKDTDVRAEPLGFQEASERVLDGTLDAMFGYAIVPSESVVSALRGGASFVPIEGPPIDRLRQHYPFVKITAIPLGMYPRMTKSVHTVGVDALLVCREGLDEGLVYELTKALVISLRPSTHPGLLPGAELGQLPATPITLHDGAARYHRERKLSR